MLPLPPTDVLRARLPRVLGAFVVIGVGIALMVRAELGLGPWDILHQGIAERTGLPFGTVGILVGLAVMLLWIPLGVRIGIGTVTNVVTIGLTIDLALALLPDLHGLGTRWAALLLGDLMVGVAAGVYIGAGLGTGPRDGVMTGLADRGWSIRAVRTALELTVMAAGWLLGGTIGIGTLVIALSLGPIIQIALGWFTLPELAPAELDLRQ